MCGRYASTKDPDELIEEFEVVADHASGQVTADFNLAPTDRAPIVLSRAPKGSDAEPMRQLRVLTWGLVPPWAKDRRGGARMINARSEDVLGKPAFRRPILARRCLVPAAGWYEWQTRSDRLDAKGKPAKEPFFLRRADGTSTAFAGLYEFWRDPSVADRDDPTAWLTSFTILTRPAEPGLDTIHHRMPLVLDRDLWSDWLSPAVVEPGEIQALLQVGQSGEPGRFCIDRVSTAVNSVRNDGPDLIRPLGVADR